jgi:hypothetical protein
MIPRANSLRRYRVLEPGLAQTIEQDHEALNALVTGDPAPKKRMFSRRDDVTLANPLGPPVRGWSEVERTLDGVGAGFRDGDPHRFERISEFATRRASPRVHSRAVIP